MIVSLSVLANQRLLAKANILLIHLASSLKAGAIEEALLLYYLNHGAIKGSLILIFRKLELLRRCWYSPT